MPWVSDKQRAWGNSPSGHKALGDSGVKEWNDASKGMKLPKKVGEDHKKAIADSRAKRE